MEKANQIQIGLLALIILMLGYMMFSGGFGSSSSSSSDSRSKARESLTSKTNNIAANNTAKANEPAKPVGPTTNMKFNEETFDFGNLTAGEKATHTFKFKNTGKEPLVISNAKGSCGCTVPKWPKEPIPPGGSGEIDVTFDSKGKKGKQTKNVTITANTDPVNTIIKISADVAEDPNAPAAAKPNATTTPALTPVNIGGSN